MTLEIFGWCIQLRAYKKRHEKPNKGIASPLKQNGAKIAFDGRYFYLCDEEGYAIPAQISVTIEDHVNEVAKATVSVHITGMTEFKTRKKHTEQN